MNLTAKKRTEMSTKQIRRAGSIPAVFYSPGVEGQSIEVDGQQFEAALRAVKSGHLATTKFTLDFDGKKTEAIIKEIQYDVTTYRVIHLDFEELKKDTHVNVNVPIECVGAEDCAGIKLGGVSRQVIRAVRVKCLPQDIPANFIVDIRDLTIGQALRLSSIKKPKGVELVSTADEVVVAIVKPRKG